MDSFVTGKTSVGMPQRRTRRPVAGFSLIEVLIALAILGVTFLWTLYLLMSQVAGNRMTALEIAATNAMRTRVEEMVAVSGDNTVAAQGAAKAVILFLNHLQAQVAGHGSNYPIQVVYSPGDRTIEYSFLMPGIGSRTPEATGTGAVTGVSDTLAQGVITVYLDESRVPAEFFTWDDVTHSNQTPNALAGFDMDGDGNFNNDFSILMTGTGTEYSSTTLRCLPVRSVVSYYNDAAHMAQDSAFFRVERYHIINDELAGLAGI